MIADLKKTTHYLFDCKFTSDDFDPDETPHLDTAISLLHDYPWKDIFMSWNAYLHEHCPTAEDVINFVQLFSYYGGTDQYIPQPYEFIGYLYYRVDMKKYWDDAGDFFDGVAISILEKSGKIDTTKDVYYSPLEDPKVLASITNYQKNNL